jgi:hypothetical protein
MHHYRGIRKYCYRNEHLQDLPITNGYIFVVIDPLEEMEYISIVTGTNAAGLKPISIPILQLLRDVIIAIRTHSIKERFHKFEGIFFFVTIK